MPLNEPPMKIFCVRHCVVALPATVVRWAPRRGVRKVNQSTIYAKFGESSC